jgi:rare lipoprotein A
MVLRPIGAAVAALLALGCLYPGAASADVLTHRPRLLLASWYGKAHHGRRTASGERFDRRALTAAHPSLPFGTLLRVTNPESGCHVIVRVNDRGPYHRGRSLDLAEAAAHRLGMTRRGTMWLKVEPAGRAELLPEADKLH